MGELGGIAPPQISLVMRPFEYRAWHGPRDSLSSGDLAVALP